MEADLVPGDVHVQTGPLGTLLELMLGRGAGADPHLVAAQTRLYHAQAAVLEQQITEGPQVCRLFDRLPPLFHLGIVGTIGSGKSRTVVFMEKLLRSVRIHTESLSGVWPDWSRYPDGGPNACVFIDEAGSVLPKRDDDPGAAECAECIRRARHKNLSMVFVGQDSFQIPPWLFRLGVELLVTDVGLFQAAFSRDETRDAMLNAHRILERVPGAFAYVNRNGVAVPIDPEVLA